MAIKAGIQLSVDGKGNLKVIDLVRGDVRKLNAETKRSATELRKMRKQTEANAKSLQSLGAKAKFAGGALLATFGVGSAVSDILRVGNAVNGLESSLTSTFGTLENGRGQLDFIRGEANRLGLEYLTLAKNFANFSASTERTSLAGKASREIFTSVAESARVLNSSVDDTNGIFRALTQIISKGTVQSEELRGQLGERIPDAFGIASRAMGLTTAELGKQLELGNVYAEEFLPKFAAELRKTFGGGLDLATQNLAANTGRIRNGLTQLNEITFDAVEGSLNGMALALGNVLNDDTEAVLGVIAVAAALVAAKIAGSSASIIASYAAQKVAKAQETTATLAANLKIAQSDQAKSAGLLKTAALEQKAAQANMNVIRQRLVLDSQAVISSGAYTKAKDRLSAANTVLATSETRAATATAALDVAMKKASISTRLMSGVAGILRGGLSLIGGPAGAALLAGAGLFYFKKQADKAKISIKGINGELVTHEDLIGKVESATYKYADATEYERKQIEKTTAAELSLSKAHAASARARIQSAKEKLKDATVAVTEGRPGLYGGLGEKNLSYAKDELAAAQAELEKTENTIYRIQASIDARNNTIEKPNSNNGSGNNNSNSGGGTNNDNAVDKEIARLAMLNAKLRLSKIEYYKLTDAYKEASPAQKEVLLNIFKSNLAIEENNKKVKESADNSSRSAEQKKADIQKVKDAITEEIKSSQDKINKLNLTDEAYERTRLAAIGFKGVALEEQIEVFKSSKALGQKAKILEATKNAIKASDNAQKRANILSNEGEIAAKAFDLTLQDVNKTRALEIALQDQATEKTNEATEKRNELKKSYENELKQLKEQFKLYGLKGKALVKAQLEAEGYDASQIKVLATQKLLNQAEEKKNELLKKGEDAYKQAIKDAEDLYQKLIKTPDAYRLWQLAQEEVIGKNAEEVISREKINEKLQKTADLNKELANLVDGSVTDAIKNFVDTGNDALDSLIAKLIEAALQGESLSGIFGSGSSNGGFGGLFSGVAKTIGIPGFAAGGFHSGGLRIVGERGPELEATGAARYYSANKTQQILSVGSNAASRSPVLNLTVHTNSDRDSQETKENNDGSFDLELHIKKNQDGTNAGLIADPSSQTHKTLKAVFNGR